VFKIESAIVKEKNMYPGKVRVLLNFIKITIIKRLKNTDMGGIITNDIRST
jgi:hypothetical protein